MLPQPEYMRNVQQSSKEVFLRTAEASQCRVHSVLVLPLFADAARRGALGVLVTTAEDMPFDSIVSTVGGILQVRGGGGAESQRCSGPSVTFSSRTPHLLFKRSSINPGRHPACYLSGIATLS
jgi:hypothetical protein